MKRYINFNCNPVLGNGIDIADVEAHVFGDTLYMYGTSKNYGIRIISTKDMKSFTDHGIVISGKDIDWKEVSEVWAPDCAFRNGNYYLYFSLPTGECCVSISKRPEGPFEKSIMIDGISGIDPAILIDDDGAAYIYYGQRDDMSVARLNDDMVSIDKSSIMHPLNEKDFGYHEGISVRKLNGKYYLVYTDTNRHGNTPVCQGYAVSDYPTHGFKYEGILIDNFGCDPSSWNNHGCIERFMDKWYIFYHCSTNNSSRHRQLFVEELEMNADGKFSEAEMTSSGMYGYINGEQIIPAAVACCLRGNVRKTFDDTISHKMILASVTEGDSALYKYLDFNGSNVFSVKTKSDVSGRIELYIDGKYHSHVRFEKSNDFETFYAEIPPINGIHCIELIFFGEHSWEYTHPIKNMSFAEFSFSIDFIPAT